MSSICSKTTMYVISGLPELLLVEPGCLDPALRPLPVSFLCYGYSISYKCDKNMENV